MVKIERNGDQVRLVLRPNRSFSWRDNQCLFVAVALWLGSFGIAFAAVGAWVILPFVGLELLALAAALYYVSWKLSHCEVLQISSDEVYIAKGITRPKASWTLPRSEVVVQIAAASHPWGTPTIQFISKCPNAVRVGEFLNQQDCKQLQQELIAARLATRRSQGRMDFPV